MEKNLLGLMDVKKDFNEFAKSCLFKFRETYETLDMIRKNFSVKDVEFKLNMRIDEECKKLRETTADRFEVIKKFRLLDAGNKNMFDLFLHSL